MIIQDLTSNTDEWLRHRRLHMNASEAPMMMSASKNVTRNELLHMKATGLDRDFSDWFQKNILDNGHVVEAAARPIAEKIVGEDLFPVSATDDEGWLAASFDGQTMLETINWECKQWNKEKAADVEAGKVPECDFWQLVHQQAVNPGSETLYMVTDGTEENCVHLWFKASDADIKRLKAGWQQFEKDLAEYVPAEQEAPKPEGKTPDALPSLVVRASGMVESSNLKEFEEAARTTLATIKTELKTDQDFADAEKNVKFCKDVESRLDSTKENVLGQMQTVDEVVRAIDSIREETRDIRLKLEKAVKTEKEARKTEIVMNAKRDFEAFVRGLDVSQYLLSLPVPDFAGAIKGKRTISTMKSACDDLMAHSKIEVNEIANTVRGNLKQIDEHAADFRFLFNDLNMIVTKPADDFAAIVKSRIADYQAEQDEKAKREADQRAQQEAAAQAKADTAADPAPSVTGQGRENQEDAEVPRNMEELTNPAMPSPNEMINVLAAHYGVSFQKAASWLASVEWRVAA